MNFRNFLEKNRRVTNKKQVSDCKESHILENLFTNITISDKNIEDSVPEQQKKKIQTPKYIGEVSVLPSASDFEDGTFVKQNSSLYIKQLGIWEKIFESKQSKEIIKYGVPGGGCGVSEVKQIINETALTKGTASGIQGIYLGTYDTVAELPITANPGDFATTRDGSFYVWGV